MPRRARIFVMLAVVMACAGSPMARAQVPTQNQPPRLPDGTQMVDGIAARVGSDVITDSEVQELAAFQQMVDGQAKPREEVIRELTDQSIVRGEADTAKYPEPSTQDVDRAYAQLAEQFGSPQEFAKKYAAAGLAEAAVRRQLQLQLYLARFLDYRFRPEVNVDDAAIQKYYEEDFAPQLSKRGESVPDLPAVHDAIREVLVQQAINDRAKQWLDDTRSGLAIDVLPDGSAP
jgi:hypothetical protein